MRRFYAVLALVALAVLVTTASAPSAAATSYPNWKVRITFTYNSVTWTAGTITPKGSIGTPAQEGALANQGKLQPWP